MTHPTPNMVLPCTVGTNCYGVWSNIAYSPTSSPYYAYVGGIANTYTSGDINKFILVDAIPPTDSPTTAPSQAPTPAPTTSPTSGCDPTGIVLRGELSRRAVTVRRPTHGRALKTYRASAGSGAKLRYTVALANKNRKKTEAAAAFERAGLVV